MESVIAAVITGLFAFAGVVWANRKTQALLAYRLDKVEEKLDKHNHFEERISTLETRTEVQSAEIRRQNERLKIMEAKP